MVRKEASEDLVEDRGLRRDVFRQFVARERTETVNGHPDEVGDSLL
jgi:hypothetical protein